ncbi:MAG: WG repeat-containing protein [Fibrobacterota bacterium]
MVIKTNKLHLLFFALLSLISCRGYLTAEPTQYEYYDKSLTDTAAPEVLTAVTDEEYLQYGARVAYLNPDNDTVIPFGSYAFFGSHRLIHFAHVIEHPNDSTYGRVIAIDRNQRILFDIVRIDNGPDSFKNGLVRVLRNGKMGYANTYGQVVIPCEYEYAKPFTNGTAEVTYSARRDSTAGEHTLIESDEWLIIDTAGNRVK